MRSAMLREACGAIKGCDTIVCWNHNWPECPLEMLELKSIDWNQLLGSEGFKYDQVTK